MKISLSQAGLNQHIDDGSFYFIYSLLFSIEGKKLLKWKMFIWNLKYVVRHLCVDTDQNLRIYGVISKNYHRISNF